MLRYKKMLLYRVYVHTYTIIIAPLHFNFISNSLSFAHFFGILRLVVHMPFPPLSAFISVLKFYRKIVKLKCTNITKPTMIP